MKCRVCGFDPEKPIGKALEDSRPTGDGKQTVNMELNENGKLLQKHKEHGGK